MRKKSLMILFFSFVSKKEVRHSYRGGGGHVFFAKYTLTIFIQYIHKKNKYLPIYFSSKVTGHPTCNSSIVKQQSYFILL